MSKKPRPDAATASELTIEGLPGADYRPLHAELLAYGGYARKPVPTLAPAQLTEEAVRHSALAEPLLVPAAPAAVAELGMALPAETLTPDRVAGHLGANYEVRTFDVTSQIEGPHWTLHQWNLYWEARRPLNKDVFVMPPPRLPQPAEDEADSAAVVRKRTADSDITGQALKGITFDCKKRLLEVQALSVAGTPLECQIQPPAAVRGADLLAQVWPADAPYRPHTSAFLVMSPAGSYSDFRLAGGGAGLWCHMVSGARTLALCPPLPRNLATYAAWAATARHSAVFLPPHCEGVLRVDLKAGDTLIIPPGWATAAATTSAGLMVAGNFLLRDSLSVHLEAWRIEEHLGVHPRSRYPLFKQLMWYTTAHYALSLQQLVGLSEEQLRGRAAEKLAEWASAEAAGAAAVPAAVVEAAGADSDSVMGTSKAGTTTQRRAGQPVSIKDDACNKPHKEQPNLSAGNRSIILQRKPPAQLAPAVNSWPAALKGPSAAAAAAVGRAERKLSGSKRRRTAAHSDSFIESDEEGSGQAASDEHEWQPAQAASSGEEEEEAPSEEEGLEEGSGGLALDDAHSPRAASPGGGGTRAQRRRAALEAAAGLPSPAAAPAGAAPAVAASAQGRKTTRFRGNLPPKLAAMLQSLSGEDSPPHASGGSGAGGSHAGHHHNHEGGTSTHRPIRLKVKLRPLDPQPAGSGDPAGAGTARTPGSATPFSRSASPRKLIVKISKAGTPRSPNQVGSAKGHTQGLQQNHAAACAHDGTAARPASALPPHPPTSNGAAAVSQAALQPLPLQLQQPRVQPATIPQVDGAFDDEGDGDSTAAVGAPAASPGQQEAGSDGEEEVVQGSRPSAPAGEDRPPAGLGGQEQQESVPGMQPPPPPLQQPLSSHEGPGQQHQQEQQRPSSQAAAASRGDAMQDEYARMYAELEEEQHLQPEGGATSAEGHAAFIQRPAESGGSVGVVVAGGARPEQQQQQQASQGPVAPAPPIIAAQQQQQQQQRPLELGQVSPSSQGRPLAAAPAVEQQQQQQVGQPGVSSVEAEGLAALLAVLKRWAAAHDALNDVPLSIKSPKEVLARLEVCMQALGLPLIPPPAVDLEAIPLDRLRPRRPPGPAGTAATAGGSKRQRSLQTAQHTSEFEAELEAAGEEAGESMEADFNVVVEESTGPGTRLEGGAGKQTAKGQQAGRGGKKLSVKNRLMKKLHFK